LLVVANEAGPVLVVELKPAKLVSVPSMMKMGGDVLQSKSYLPSAIHSMYLLKGEMMPYAY
jgi:hypothetical protein